MAFDRAAFADLYPFESRFCAVGNVNMHYLDEGSGEPVVMLHGNPTWSFYWRELVKELRGAHRVIAPDHVGCGLSDKPTDAEYPYVLERRIEDLETFLDRIGLREPVTLVVHDWGGMIGLGWAVRHPERVARLVILNTAGFRLPAAKPLPLSLGLARTAGLGAFAVRGFNAFARGATRACVVKPLDPRVAAGLVAPYDSWRTRIAVHRFVQDIPLRPGDPSWDALVRVEEGLPRLAAIPTTIAWGARDFVFDDHFLREFRQRLPGAEVHVFEDAGHYVMEDARDRVVALVRALLARPAAGLGSRGHAAPPALPPATAVAR